MWVSGNTSGLVATRASSNDAAAPGCANLSYKTGGKRKLKPLGEPRERPAVVSFGQVGSFGERRMWALGKPLGRPNAPGWFRLRLPPYGLG